MVFQASQRKKLYQLLFDLFPYNSKKTSSFPKIFGEISLVLKFLEFWKTRVFFGILVENLKNHCAFLEFAMKFQKKTLCFLMFWDQIPKKPRVFQNSKIPKKKLSTCPIFFWKFGILENSRFFWNCKGIGQKEVGITFLYDLGIASKRKKLYQLLFDLFPYNSKKTSSFPKFQNSKNIWAS